MASAALPPGSHRIWGSANPRSLLGTNSDTSGSSSRVRRLEQHLSNVIFHDEASSESAQNSGVGAGGTAGGEALLQVRVKNTFLEFTENSQTSGMARSRSSGELSRSSQGSVHHQWEGASPVARGDDAHLAMFGQGNRAASSGNNLPSSGSMQVAQPGAAAFIDDVPSERAELAGGQMMQQMSGANDGDDGDDGADEIERVGVEAEGWTGPLPSIGSELHAKGECRPCLYLRAKSGCFNGENCKFCHFSHVKKSRPRPCKAKRAECKRIVAMLDNVFGEDQESLQKAADRLANESAYMRTVIRGKKNKEMRELLEKEHIQDEDRGLAIGNGARGGGQQDLPMRAPGGPTSSSRGPAMTGPPGMMQGGYPNMQQGGVGGWNGASMQPMSVATPSYAGGMPSDGSYFIDDRAGRMPAPLQGMPQPRRGQISL
mmetsp:Transcript_46821/g.111390  ORF Transcript_46821/g.111390 Transcript_46821/m.111390 type:complete len:430 (-) Transcript_46821:113-1402(-)